MAKNLIRQYVFSPGGAGAGSIRIPGRYSLEQILLITNTTRNTVIYNFSDPTLGSSSFTNTLVNNIPITTIVLSYNTASHQSTDKISILVEEVNETIQMSDALTDPVGKMRTSTPQALIDTDFEYSTQSTKWESLSLINNRPYGYYNVYNQLTFTDITASNLMEWVEIRKDYISNYQSKMFLYPLVHQRHGLGYADALFNDFIPSRDDMVNQVNKVDFFYKTIQGTESNKEQMKTIIWDEFQIPPEKRISAPSLNSWDHAHQVSADLYNSLSESDKNKIAEINAIDMEIYETNSLFWKNGVV